MPQFATDLESLLAGRVTVDELRAAHPKGEFGEVSETIWVSLERFLADAEKREADLSYCHMQLSEMRKLIKLIEAGGGVTEFTKITFLAAS